MLPLSLTALRCVSLLLSQWVRACLQDNEAVLEHLMARRDVKRALAVLRRPNVSQELLYKFAPALMEAAPEEAVTAFITAQPALDAPRCLLPPIPARLPSAAPRTHLTPRRLLPSNSVTLQHVLWAPLCISELGCSPLPRTGQAATHALQTVTKLQPAACSLVTHPVPLQLVMQAAAAAHAAPGGGGSAEAGSPHRATPLNSYHCAGCCLCGTVRVTTPQRCCLGYLLCVCSAADQL